MDIRLKRLKLVTSHLPRTINNEDYPYNTKDLLFTFLLENIHFYRFTYEAILFFCKETHGCLSGFRYYQTVQLS